MSINKVTNNSERKLTFQEYQSIYSEITQKDENLTKYYSRPFRISKNHIQHLNEIMLDTLRQYQIVSINSDITVYQSNNMKKRFSSIENFLTIDTTAKATEQIIIEYDLLVKVPNIEKKQSYKIIIKVISDLVVFESVRNSLPVELIDMIEKNNIEVKIDYIDYTIAKSIINTINDWVEDISQKDNKVLSFFENKKNQFAFIVKTLILLFSFILIYTYIPHYISIENTNMQLFSKFVIISFGLLYISNKIAIGFSRLIKISLSFLQNFSYIELTEEDKKNIKHYENKKYTRIFSFFITVLLTIGYGVISSLIANNI